MGFTANGRILHHESQNLSQQMIIKSRNKNYTVNFKRRHIDANVNDVLVIDRKLHDLYNIGENFKHVIKIDATEENKNMETVLNVVDQLSGYNFKKNNKLHVYGGGITQDIAGMTASMYKRGISWSYTPTTLLSMCDSCIGSKVNVNFKSHKNQIGTMYPPDEVFIDTSFLQTLPKSDIDSGMGEILKLFSIAGIPWDVENIENCIRTCLEIKKVFIEEDEYENTIRPILNYGHTFGHVFETLSDFKIPHGIAVLLGMYVVDNYFGQDVSKYNLLNEKVKKYSKHIVRDEDLFLKVLQSDKKARGNILNLIKVENGTSQIIETRMDLNLVKNIYSYIDNI